MPSELGADLAVVLGVIGEQPRLAGDALAHDLADFGLGQSVQVDGSDLAATFHQGEDGVLVGVAAPDLHSLLATDEGLVGLDGNPAAAQRGEAAVAHGLTQTVRHEPRRLERYAEDAMKLVTADALFGRAEKVDSLQPLVHGHMAVLKDRPDLDRERLTAGCALAEAQASALSFEGVGAPYHAAARAHGAVRPELGFHELVRGFLALSSGWFRTERDMDASREPRDSLPVGAVK
jgi:hypothetical protein